MTGFVDEVTIVVTGGCGGNGVVSFLRERARPKGGPNGGNGGRGGSVIMCASRSLSTLQSFIYQRNISAMNGGRGMGKNKHGKDGANTCLQVPVGTRIIDADTQCLHADLSRDEQQTVLVEGGRGGLGNTHFKSSTNRVPRQSVKGEVGMARRFCLQLILLADISLIGMPNAGKSTLLSAISNASAKTGDYPFTTLQPQLGVVSSTSGDEEVVVVDIPGLIKGAASGAGLGNRFLRHLSRTTILCQVVDAASSSLYEDCHTIDEELRCASKTQNLPLTHKRRWLAMNKIDQLSDSERQDRMAGVRRRFPFFECVFMVSALSGEYVREAIDTMLYA